MRVGIANSVLGRLMILAALSLCSVAGAQVPRVPLHLSPPAQPQVVSGAYSCPVPQQPAVRAAWQVLRDYGETDFSCGNAFAGWLETVSPIDPAAPDAFTKTNRQILAARAEVLISNMDFHVEPDAPTQALLDAIAELYRRVRAGGTAAYPQGMQVRLHLGNYPLPERPARWIAQTMAEGLLARGVPLRDGAVGWEVSLAHYRALPHSHAKLHVIDGRQASVYGYGYALTWLPYSPQASRPDGGANDLGITMRGPVAQNAAAAFSDLWTWSDQLTCPPDIQAGEVADRCRWTRAAPLRRPALAREVIPSGQATALLLYRRPGYQQADRAHLALLGAARRQIDLMQTSLSSYPNCVALQPWPDICRDMPLPVYYEALLDAMRRGVRVRVLTMSGKIEGLQNRTGVLILRRAAQERGLSHLLEVRATDYPMHSKAVLVDAQAVLVGSMNFHFSAWGPLGLAEAALLTDDPQAVQELQARFDADWQGRSQPFLSFPAAAQ